MSRRRMMMLSMQQERKVRKELEVYEAGTVVFRSSSNQVFLKTNDGLAIVGYCHRVNDAGAKYTSPIIVSTDFDAATLSYDITRVLETYRSFEYEGQLYHCGQLDYSAGGHVAETTGRWLINNGEVFTNNPENAAVQAGRALLDYYFYKT